MPFSTGMPSRLYEGERRAWTLHADAVAAWTLDRGGVAPTGLAPADPLFAGEWDLAACQMSVLGLVQVIEAFPDTAERYLPAVRACTTWLASEPSRAFGAARWGRDELGAAYVGYSALPLARAAEVDPDFAHSVELDAMIAALAPRLSDPIAALETYPGEVYPPDQTVVAAAVAVHGDHDATVQAWVPRFEATAVDPDTGGVYQALAASGQPVDHARGSGTTFAGYFLSFVDRDLSRRVHEAAQHRAFGPFGGVLEYPSGVSGWGDIDSGPVLFGVGVSPTGFGLAGARIHGDRDAYLRSQRTARLFGLPVPWNGRWYVTGGGLGNAILLAMSTAGSPYL